MPVTGPSFNFDVLVEVHVECSIERLAVRGDVNHGGSARIADDDHP